MRQPPQTAGFIQGSMFPGWTHMYCGVFGKPKGLGLRLWVDDMLQKPMAFAQIAFWLRLSFCVHFWAVLRTPRRNPHIWLVPLLVSRPYNSHGWFAFLFRFFPDRRCVFASCGPRGRGAVRSCGRHRTKDEQHPDAQRATHHDPRRNSYSRFSVDGQELSSFAGSSEVVQENLAAVG